LNIPNAVNKKKLIKQENSMKNQIYEQLTGQKIASQVESIDLIRQISIAKDQMEDKGALNQLENDLKS
jgi:hypothetical protein